MNLFVWFWGLNSQDYSAIKDPTGNTVMLYQKEMHEAIGCLYSGPRNNFKEKERKERNSFEWEHNVSRAIFIYHCKDGPSRLVLRLEI